VVGLLRETDRRAPSVARPRAPVRPTSALPLDVCAAPDHEGDDRTHGERETLQHRHGCPLLSEPHVRATRKHEGNERAGRDYEALQDLPHGLRLLPRATWLKGGRCR
jgi:hypothetical protein